MTRIITLLFIALYPIAPSFFRIAGQESGLVLACVFCLLYLIAVIGRGGKLRFNKKLGWILFTCIALMCIPPAYHHEWQKAIRYVVEYFVVVMCLFDYFRTEKQVHEAVNVLLTVCAVMCIIGIMEFVTKQSIFWPLFNGTSTDMSPDLQIRGAFARSETVFGHSITYGIYLGFCGLITSYYSIITKKKKYMGIYTLIIINLLCTISRGPIIFYIIAQLLLLYFMGFRTMFKILLRVIAVGVMTLLFIYFAFPQIFSSLQTIFLLVLTIFSDNAASAASSITGSNYNPFWYRLGLIGVIPEYLKGNYLVGRGTNLSFTFSLGGHTYYSIDNNYLATALKYGFIGLGGFLVPLVSGFLMNLKKKGFKQDNNLSKMFVCIVIVYVLNLVSVAQMSEYRMWIVLFSIMCAYRFTLMTRMQPHLEVKKSEYRNYGGTC